MMAARSHSMSSTTSLTNFWKNQAFVLTLVEVGLIEVVWPWDIHIIQASDLFPSVLTLAFPITLAYVTMASEVL